MTNVDCANIISAFSAWIPPYNDNIDIIAEISNRSTIGEYPGYAEIIDISTSEFNQITSKYEKNDEEF